MTEKQYNKISENILYYKVRFIITTVFFFVGIVALVLLITSMEKGKNNVDNVIYFLLLILLMSLFLSIDVKFGLLYKEYKAIQNSEILKMKQLDVKLVIDGLKDRLHKSNFKLKVKNENITIAHKSNIKYGLFYYQNIGVRNIERLKLSKIPFLELKKFHYEMYFLVNIIITDSFNEDLVEFFSYNGNRLIPQHEIFIGYDLAASKVYMNYGYNNSLNDDYIKELKMVCIF